MNLEISKPKTVSDTTTCATSEEFIISAGIRNLKM